MRFANRLAGLSRPDWRRVSIAIVWLVFGWNFIGLPILHNVRDPKSPIHDPIVSKEFFQASLDTAAAIASRAQKLGNDYQADQYAHDMFWLRTREQVVRHWLPPSSSYFDALITVLHAQVVKAEEARVVAQCRAAGQSQEMCERIASVDGFQRVGLAINKYQTDHHLYLWKGISAESWKRFGWHFASSSLWAILATALLLLLRLRFSKQHSLKEELLLAPDRLFWACIFWAHGIANYPGDDIATDIRYVRLRNKFLKKKDSWGLTREEDAALRLMARRPVVRFEEALQTVATAGVLMPPRRTVFATLLIAITSGPSALRTHAAATEIVATQLALSDVAADKPVSVHPTGGKQLPADTSVALPSRQGWDEPQLSVIGGAVALIDERRRFRTIRVMGSRAPPVTTGGAR